MKCYRSCFIVDVKIDNTHNKAILTDSTRNRFIVDLSNDTTKKSFDAWLTHVFLDSKPQTPTVFEYTETEINECEIQINIILFKNVSIHNII
jgi:hypothetical protein